MSSRGWWGDLLAVFTGGFAFEDSWSIAVWTVLTAALLVPLVGLILAFSRFGWPL